MAGDPQPRQRLSRHDPGVDTFLAIASRREVRDYAETPIPADVERRILDAGRLSGSAQNMLLAAWNDGVGSCPNGISDADAAERIVGAPVGIVLTFGYPAKPRHPESRSAEEWSARAKRKLFDEV